MHICYNDNDSHNKTVDQNPEEIHPELVAEYGKYVMSSNHVLVWCSEFSGVQIHRIILIQSVHDHQQQKNNITRVETLILVEICKFGS